MRMTPTTSGHFPPESSSMTWPPTIELTMDHPIQAMTLAKARSMAPYHPKLNLRELVAYLQEIRVVPRNSHGTKTHFGTKGSHICGRNHSDQVEEENSQERIPPSKEKQTWSKGT